MKFRSVRFKVSVLYTTILGLILIAYSASLYFNLTRVVYRQIDANLVKKLNEVESIINTYSGFFESDKDTTPVSLKRALRLDEVTQEEFFQWPSIKKADEVWQYKIHTLGIKQGYIVIYYPTGEVVERSNNVADFILKILEADFKTSSKKKAAFRNVLTKDLQLRVITRAFTRWGTVRYVIQLATPIEPQLFTLQSKMKLILTTIPIFLLLTSFIGWFLVVKVLEPISEIAQTAQAISTKDMAKRVPVEHADEELKSLAEAFNDMIARLEKSFKYIEEFSSNVAHELKTPLAIIRGELELMLRKDRTPEEYKKAIAIGLDEAQRMLKTVNDLLLLAKLDYHTEIFKFETVDLREFMTEIFEQSRILAGAKSIAMSLDLPPEALTARVDRLHLRRLFFNLIDNAIKFTPRSGRIDIALRRSSPWAEVTVADTGVGIAEADLPKIFDRFFHVDRTDEAPSVNGLGLSLVQSIARVHNGGVDVKSELGGGSVFTVKLPMVWPE